MNDFWGLYIQGSEVPIFLGLLVLLVILPLGLYQAKKRHGALLVSLKTLATDLGGEFFYKQFAVENLADMFSDPDCSEYRINLDLGGRECVILPYAYPSHISRHRLSAYAPWATVFRLKMKQSSRSWFSLKYGVNKFFSLPFQKNADFKESNISIENKDFIDKIIGYDELVSFIKNIQFISMPFFEMKVSDNLLYIKVDKVENEITDVKKYLDFIEKIAKNIENDIDKNN
jgi:hypothetical protein